MGLESGFWEITYLKKLKFGKFFQMQNFVVISSTHPEIRSTKNNDTKVRHDTPLTLLRYQQLPSCFPIVRGSKNCKNLHGALRVGSFVW